MLSKSDFRNIVKGLLGTFVSRNNDINGYWGLGILRSIADSKSSRQITIDLLDVNIENELVESCKNRHREWLSETLEGKGASIDSLSAALIRINFESSFESYPELVKDTRGIPYECTVEIKLTDGVLYSAKKVGVCAPHDPSVDRKRALI